MIKLNYLIRYFVARDSSESTKSLFATISRVIFYYMTKRMECHVYGLVLIKYIAIWKKVKLPTSNLGSTKASIDSN